MHRVPSRSGDVLRPRMIGAPTQQEIAQTRMIVIMALVLLERAL